MAELVMVKFSGLGRDDYDAVSKALNIDPETGTGDLPDGLLVHTAGTGDDGGWVVTEIWESRDAQADFMNGRLGEALGGHGVTETPEVTWVSLEVHQQLG